LIFFTGGEGEPHEKNPGILHALYPLPSSLAGAMVDGKGNFITMAHVAF